MSAGTGSPGKITKKLIVKKSDGVGYLILNQPEKHNAISYEMWLGIAQVIADFEADDDMRVIVVSGEGGAAFSSGADISQFERQRQSAEKIKVYDGAAGRAQDNSDQSFQADNCQDYRVLHRWWSCDCALL